MNPYGLRAASAAPVNNKSNNNNKGDYTRVGREVMSLNLENRVE